MGIFVITAAVILIACAILKIYMKLTTGWNTSRQCLVGKTAIVTGSNIGIGYNTALDFATRGAKVILACRNKDKAEEARKKIVEETGNDNVIVKIVDMSSLSSVRAFAKDVNSTEKRLDILVNNAGAAGLGKGTTEDGLDLLLQTNHFGPFLLTNLLIGLLKASAPSRIVNVSSVTAHYTRIDPNNINSYPTGPNFIADSKNYFNSKLLNVLFTNELARKLEGTGVTANSLHPGVIHTAWHRNYGAIYKCIHGNSMKLLFKTCEEGAQTTVYLSISSEVKDITGKYFADCKIATMPRNAVDVGVAKKVWERSEEFVSLAEHERQL